MCAMSTKLLCFLFVKYKVITVVYSVLGKNSLLLRIVGDENLTIEPGLPQQQRKCSLKKAIQISPV